MGVKRRLLVNQHITFRGNVIYWFLLFLRRMLLNMKEQILCYTMETKINNRMILIMYFHLVYKFMYMLVGLFLLRNGWTNQNGNQRPSIYEQTIQWPNKREQMDKRWSTLHKQTKNWETRIPLKPLNELGFLGMVSSPCSISDTRRFTLVTNQVINLEWRK